MGQYYILVNVDKKEYAVSHDLGGVAKLGEWCTSAQSLVFPYLMALCNGEGGGDPDTNLKLKYLGRWAGDRVVLVGDYWKTGPYANLYSEVRDKDIEYTEKTIERLKESIKSLRTPGGECYMNSPADRKRMAKENEVKLVHEKKHLADLLKLPRSERYVNISAELKNEFENLYGKDALDWTESPYVKGVGMPDMVIGYSIPKGKNKLAE